MLINKLKQFIKSKKEKIIIQSTIEDIRPLYKGKEPFRALMYYIFNSMFNRTPDLNLKEVRKRQLEYVMRIGSGVASYNLVSISWITNKVVGDIKNFILKDRGHIFETVIRLYNHKWNLKEVTTYCGNILLEAEGTGKKITKAMDPTRHRAAQILTKVSDFLKQEKKRQSRQGTKVDNQRISIKTICENIKEFDKYVNKQHLSIEATKESIWAHCREMLNLNNILNGWIDYLKAFLNFNQYVMLHKGGITYLKETLKIETLQTELSNSDIWSFKSASKAPILMSKGIKSFKDKIKEYTDVIPFKLLGSTYKQPDFTKTSGDYHDRTPKHIEDKLNAIYDNKATYEDAHERLRIFELIVKQNGFWKSFYKAKENLFEKHSKDKALKIDNLKHCTIESESFGMACARACYDLIMKTCDDRSSNMLIQNTVMKFTEKLTEVLEEVCEDKTLFVESSMEKRFDRVILPAYLSILNDKSTTLSKKELRKIHLGELDSVFFGDVKETKFKYINPLIEKYNNPKIKEMDFDKVVNNAKESNIDLGQKIQTDGYTLENTFLQIKGHNRSSSDGNHTIDNVEYWIWLAEENQKLVNHHEEYLVKNKMFDVIVDAEKLTKIFK